MENKITEEEIIKLEDYLNKRFEDFEGDSTTFDSEAEADMSLTYEENFNILKKKIDDYLQDIQIPKLKKDCKGNIPKEMEKELNEKIMREEHNKELEIMREKEEKVIEQIINSKTSEELEKLYFIPKNYIKMVAERKEIGLLLFGESSLGKTFQVKRVLAEMGKKEGVDYFIISGHITPMQFYVKLFSARDKVVVFDDVNILESKINLNMLKGALNENSFGQVEYFTSRKMPEGVPSSFIFTGQVIILLNDKPKNNEHLRAVENRILTYELKFTYEEIIRILFEVAKNDNLDINKGIPRKERFELVKWIKEHTNKATKNLNIRLYQHIIRFYKFDRANWERLAKNYIQNDEYLTMIIQGVGEREFIGKTGLCRRSYYNYKQKVQKCNEKCI